LFCPSRIFDNGVFDIIKDLPGASIFKNYFKAFQQMDIQGHIRETLSELKTDNQENIQQTDLLNALRDKGNFHLTHNQINHFQAQFLFSLRLYR
jgi:hypothetical protein